MGENIKSPVNTLIETDLSAYASPLEATDYLELPEGASSAAEPNHFVLSEDLPIYATGQTEKRSPHSDIIRKTAGSLACLALLIGGGKITEAISVQDAAAKTKRSVKCLPNQQIDLSLIKRKYSRPGQAAFTVKAKSCKKTTPKLLKNVVIKESVQEPGPDYQRRMWKFKTFKPNQAKRRDFSIILPKPESNISMPIDKTQTIVLEAFTKKAARVSPKRIITKTKLLGKKIYKISSTGEPYESVQPEQLNVPKNCNPDPDFEVGIHDDNAFVYQKTVTRTEAFRAATEIFDSKVLRINYIYGAVQKYGKQVYIDTINEAAKHGYKVYLTLMATPSYNPDMDQDLNYKNLDPVVMKQFAQDAAATVRSSTIPGTVTAYIIHNEPNHRFFNESLGTRKFNNMYIAGRDGVRMADKTAKILPGGLAPDTVESLNSWLANHREISNSYTLHPYDYVMNRVPGIAAANPNTDMYLTEYGNPASDPEQAKKNAQAIITAKCAGAEVLTFMQLFRYPNIKTWNTGVIDSPPGSDDNW